MHYVRLVSNTFKRLKSPILDAKRHAKILQIVVYAHSFYWEEGGQGEGVGKRGEGSSQFKTVSKV